MSSGQYCDECSKSWTTCECEENKMTNKEQLLNKLANLQKNISDAQKQAEELQKQINQPEKPKALLERVTTEDSKYYNITGYNYVLQVYQSTLKENPFKGNSFTTREQAENYRKAFETFLELRRCEGSGATSENTQYIIRPNDKNGLYIANTCWSYIKLSDISPCFSDKVYAEAAIEKLGEENILHMFKTFHGLT